ncbi:MAG: geranylgeranylglycerol-phosphate geranylgeranyltransferase [Bacteroidota bacterium]
MNSYLKIVRPLNLLIIAVSMFMVRHYLIAPFLKAAHSPLQMGNIAFILLVISIVLLAAGGYIINDYYDAEIDKINRPDDVIVGRSIPMRTASNMHLALSAVAVLIGFYCGWSVGSFKLGFVQFIIAMVLYYYALKYKRMLITGNLVVALITSSAIVLVWLFEFFAIKNNGIVFGNMIGNFGNINIFVFGMTLFAFLICFIREVVKDMEDIAGDEACGCHSIPVVYGISKSKKILVVMVGVLMLFTVFVQVLLFRWHYNIASSYFFLIHALNIYLLLKLRNAQSQTDFHFMSTVMKIIMLAGLLSMQMLYINF